jgi:hypothetical protein
MNNPTVEGNYTTIFKDGSIIYENPWMIRKDGTGKWYWNEDVRGGVVAWNKIPEGGYKFHTNYRLPDWELHELVYAQLTLEALEHGGVDDWEWYSESIKDYCNSCHADSIEDIVKEELETGYYSGYKMKT